MKRGFTLIELLVVISIIGLLSTVVLSSLATAKQKAQDAKVVADFAQLKNAIEIQYNTKGKYNLQEEVSTVPDPGLYMQGFSEGPLASLVSERYISKLPLAQSGTIYFYGYILPNDTRTYCGTTKIKTYMIGVWISSGRPFTALPSLNTSDDGTTFSPVANVYCYTP
jgi:prepilin-type N-terminal cleavage/methylation domain-containing protein